MKQQAASAEAEEEPARARGTLSETMRSQLEEMIVDGTLRPGERLDEFDLAQRFKVSRTPVREAVKALVATGLLEMRPRQGLVVVTISIPVLLEMFQMMAMQEGLCARLAARRASPAQRTGLRAIHARLIEALAIGDPLPFYDINTEFHELIYDSSQTQFIAAQTRALRRRVAAYRRYVTYQPGRMVTTIAEHGRILEAIERADADATFQAAVEHMTLLGDDMADFIAAIPPAMLDEG